MTLDEWIDVMDYRYMESQWLCHIKQYVKEESEAKALVRLIFISLRQDFQKETFGV